MSKTYILGKARFEYHDGERTYFWDDSDGCRTWVSEDALLAMGAVEEKEEEIEELEYCEAKDQTATFGKALRAPDIDEVVGTLNLVIKAVNRHERLLKGEKC